MSYQVPTEDLTKVISLTLTAEQLETIAGALEMYCIGLAEHNDPHLKYAADAQEAIIEVLESNFSVDAIDMKPAYEAGHFFSLKKMIVDCKLANHDPLRAVFLGLNGEPNEMAKEIGVELDKIGGLKSMQDIANMLLNFCRNNGYSTSDVRELECCWDGIGEWRA